MSGHLGKPVRDDPTPSLGPMVRKSALERFEVRHGRPWTQRDAVILGADSLRYGVAGAKLERAALEALQQLAQARRRVVALAAHKPGTGGVAADLSRKLARQFAVDEQEHVWQQLGVLCPPKATHHATSDSFLDTVELVRDALGLMGLLSATDLAVMAMLAGHYQVQPRMRNDWPSALEAARHAMETARRRWRRARRP